MHPADFPLRRCDAMESAKKKNFARARAGQNDLFGAFFFEKVSFSEPKHGWNIFS
jgi:hypothetical protein